MKHTTSLGMGKCL